MLKKTNRAHNLWKPMLCLLAMALFACAADEEFAGTYYANGSDSSERSETVLELKEGGEGIWRVENDETLGRFYTLLKNIDLTADKYNKFDIRIAGIFSIFIDTAWNKRATGEV